ncbi:MAG: rhamnulokinase [Pirellulaceae bacterium]|nr:rhamnulokinase [Pirellulaceae bacterium]
MSTWNSSVALAIDLGASSGRLVAGLFDGQRIVLEEVHRFGNRGVQVGPRMYWDILRLWTEVQDGLRKAQDRYGSRVATLGVDTWGVDFALLDRDDELLSNPLHYRDRQKAGILERSFQTVSRQEIFATTGLQFMEFNSLFQLISMRETDSPVLEAAASMLMIPDLFHWLLTGEKANEFTNATTTQFYNPAQGCWAKSLLERFDLPTGILGEIVHPGSVLGPLRSDVADEVGLSAVKVVLPGTHDTASAVMAVPTTDPPCEQPDWCYISSGTWSLMGVEVPRPLINETCLQLNFTNEGGVGETIRVLKNIAGLWLIQECRRVWQQAGNAYDWEDLVELAAASPPLVSLISPDDQAFVSPRSMPETVCEYCRSSGQDIPASEGAVIRCILESLALRYRLVLGWLEELTGGTISTVHIVGGGTQNKLLCQMAADACNRRVVAGPVEATAIGNLMMQLVAAGEIGSIREARSIVSSSFPVDTYEPQDPGPWNAAFERFQLLINKEWPT